VVLVSFAEERFVGDCGSLGTHAIIATLDVEFWSHRERFEYVAIDLEDLQDQVDRTRACVLCLLVARQTLAVRDSLCLQNRAGNG